MTPQPKVSVGSTNSSLINGVNFNEDQILEGEQRNTLR